MNVRSIIILDIKSRISGGNFYRGKVASGLNGRYEDGSGLLRELPVDFIWTQEQSKYPLPTRHSNQNQKKKLNKKLTEREEKG